MNENRRELAAGTIVFSEGDFGDAMYVVIQGMVQIYRDTTSGRLVLIKVGPGEFFGEMALIGNTPRTATATALSDSVLAVYRPDELEKLLATRPDIGARMIKHLVSRLKETTDRLEGERDKRLGSW
ncbi:MAG: cyclic nucleotide-binding domain-containing protein [Arenicellales bacterium]